MQMASIPGSEPPAPAGYPARWKKTLVVLILVGVLLFLFLASTMEPDHRWVVGEVTTEKVLTVIFYVGSATWPGTLLVTIYVLAGYVKYGTRHTRQERKKQAIKIGLFVGFMPPISLTAIIVWKLTLWLLEHLSVRGEGMSQAEWDEYLQGVYNQKAIERSAAEDLAWKIKQNEPSAYERMAINMAKYS
ncbi:MAG: hypothetical protein LBR20_06480 [Propionibacteriaceae bacterium]|jgi:heme/copper-type cytochrome/quinol oxidase subunit 4|nr:hypothetical protein [Propionibacteriaceae bacterium]